MDLLLRLDSLVYLIDWVAVKLVVELLRKVSRLFLFRVVPIVLKYHLRLFVELLAETVAIVLVLLSIPLSGLLLLSDLLSVILPASFVVVFTPSVLPFVMLVLVLRSHLVERPLPDLMHVVLKLAWLYLLTLFMLRFVLGWCNWRLWLLLERALNAREF
jgi:hypothetical protein